MVPSWKELGARTFLTRFLSSHITIGCLILLEDGGTMFTFEATRKASSPKSVLRVHNPQFYWKGELGLAEAYINADFSFVDKDEGLLNFFLILIAINNSNQRSSKSKNRGWWSPIFWTSTLASSKYFMKHLLRRNTITQARINISEHYDKAKIDKTHELLDIGCGWGSVVIEAVKQTGCKCTGITLSKEQLKLAEKRVKDLGLQFISIRDELDDEKRLSPGFLKEYIFPGGLVPSLSRVTSAMAAASKLCVDNIESIGIHYFETLRRWRKNFLERQSEIMALGFDEKTIRTWEFYFDNCAAGFKSGILGDYQVVFSRPDNVA
ncbi:hypothetical protein Fmac_001728 [Flemingia macrophylla]|uniref:Cyclopropane-fatty-acyl-phospholipid synthase n=1 Tax=Flemingia macrophylla TaxID=520843 RepID=A0ABD1NHX6_9FABA